MSLLKRQQAGREIGRIRIGASVATDKVDRNGVAYRRPVKLDTFRLTTRSRPIADAVAKLFGGTVEHDDRVGWDVVTTATELPVMVPPGQDVVNSAWELWAGRSCERRCDGDICTLPDRSTVPCLCPPEGPERMDLAAAGRACKLTTRLNLVIPDLPDLGVWRLESHGYYAHIELDATAEFLKQARDAGVMLPARLWLDHRSRVVGGKTRNWVVPMLSLTHTMRQLAAGSARAEMMPPEPRAAITTGAPASPNPGQPVPSGGTVLTGEVIGSESDTAHTAEHQAAWAGPVVTVPASPAQAIADRAGQSESVAMLKALAVQADEKGLADEMVTVDGADEPLGPYLAARRDQLAGGA